MTDVIDFDDGEVLGEAIPLVSLVRGTYTAKATQIERCIAKTGNRGVRFHFTVLEVLEIDDDLTADEKAALIGKTVKSDRFWMSEAAVGMLERFLAPAGINYNKQLRGKTKTAAVEFLESKLLDAEFKITVKRSPMLNVNNTAVLDAVTGEPIMLSTVISAEAA